MSFEQIMNRYKMEVTENRTTLFLILILIFLFLLLAYQSEHRQKNEKVLELIFQSYGGLIATFVGIYVSINLSKQEDIKKETKRAERVLMASYKIIWSELDINEDILGITLEGLKDMPINLVEMYSQMEFIMSHMESLKSKAFYSTFSSGAINELSLNTIIFNSLQQAYYNIELFHGSLKVLTEYYKNFRDPNYSIHFPNIKEAVKSRHQLAINNLEHALKLTAFAKKDIFDYLISKGVKFNTDEILRQKASNYSA